MRTGRLKVWLLVAVACIWPFDAFAQEHSDASAAADFYDWDIAGTLGLAILDQEKAPPYGAEHNATPAWNLDVGRYLSPHLKIDAGLMRTGLYDNSAPRSFPIAGVPPEYYFLTWAQTKARTSAFSAAATYQFFENQFAHPFVSAGIAVMRQDEHSVRPAQVATINRVPYTIPAVDERATRVVARPFVAAGWKSYFNERVFIRSELLVAARRDGFSHATMRVGAGFDF